METTTEFMAGEIFRRMQARIGAGALGPGTASALTSMRVVLRESPVACASRLLAPLESCGLEGPLR